MAGITGRPDFLRLWGIVRGAVELPELRGNRNLAAQYIHNTYRQSYLAAGETPPPLSVQAVNEVLGLAFDQRQAKRELGRAVNRYLGEGVDTILSPAMRAPDIDAEPGAGFVRPERLRVRIGYTTTEETVPTQWVTRELDLGEVSSVSEVVDLAEEYAASRAADYSLEYDGLDAIEITYT